MARSFAVTFDYRCPFARNAHEHLLAGLAAGAEWDVRFVPFSLDQVHVAEGEPDIWDRPGDDTGLFALSAGIVVRDEFPAAFPTVHRALFAARHDHGLRIRDRQVVLDVLAAHLPDDAVEAVRDRIDGGDALATVAKEHTEATTSRDVWGVPTFMGADRAVFVRLMDRNPGETPEQRSHGRRTIERILDLVDGWAELNEFKATRIPR